MNHTERFNALINKLREIAAKLLTSSHDERVPLLAEYRVVLRKLDDIQHEDGKGTV